MGLADFFRRKMGNSRAEKAADQMYAALVAGKSFEVPAYLSTDDVAMQAVMILSQKYPDVQVKMLQSKGIVLSRKKSAGVSEEAWNMLDKGGYFPEQTENPTLFVAQHEEFMRRQHKGEAWNEDLQRELDKQAEKDRAEQAVVLTRS